MLPTEPISPGTGSNADYTSSSATLTFDGSNTIQCVRIPINDDEDLEPDERFTVSLTTTEPDVILDPRNGEVTIINDDGQCPFIYSPFVPCSLCSLSLTLIYFPKFLFFYFLHHFLFPSLLFSFFLSSL